MKNSFELKETIQSRDFETPVNSKLKVKLNGTKKQNVDLTLQKIIIYYTANGRRPHVLTPITRKLKGNSKETIDIESNCTYSLSVQANPFIPFTVEYSVIKYEFHSDLIAQVGLTLFTTGFVVFFAS